MQTTPVNLPSELVEAIAKLKFTEIIELEKIPTLDFEDTILVVTENNITGRATVDQLMQYLNENLRNFIMWKPVVTNKTLSWERSNDDTPPMSLDFADILFPIVSETENGMMTTDLYKKLRGIDSQNIVYKKALDTAIATRAPKEHTHDQYLIRDNLPTVVSAFKNDVGYITSKDIPTKLSAFQNDTEYLRYEDVPIVDETRSGFMTPELLSNIERIMDSYVDNDVINVYMQKFIKILDERKLSDFENDVPYVTEEMLHDTIGEVGTVNLLANSNFAAYTYSDKNMKYWKCENATIYPGIYMGGTSVVSFATLTIQPGGSVTGQLIQSIGLEATVSMYVKSTDALKLTLTIANCSCIYDIDGGSVWEYHECLFTNDYTVASNTLKITNESDTEVVIDVANIKVEMGKFSSAYMPSYIDIVDMSRRPASADFVGNIKPDGVTTIVDDNGVLSVVRDSTGVAFINDDSPTTYNTYSSYKTESLLRGLNNVPISKYGYAPIDSSKKVPADFLPSFVDDVVEGEMSIDADGNMIFIADTTNSGILDSAPSKGKIYLDTISNIAYRWSGSTYVQCTTDKLGGAVLVKYNAEDKYMYFVFPEE